MAQAGWSYLGPINIDHVGFGSRSNFGFHCNYEGQHLFGTGVGLAMDDVLRKTLIFALAMSALRFHDGPELPGYR